MTEQTELPQPAASPKSGPTKAVIVQKLLARAKGATLAEIGEVTGWLPHSTRAFMTGLRKKGHELIRECRASGESAWRLER